MIVVWTREIAHPKDQEGKGNQNMIAVWTREIAHLQDQEGKGYQNMIVGWTREIAHPKDQEGKGNQNMIAVWTREIAHPKDQEGQENQNMLGVTPRLTIPHQMEEAVLITQTIPTLVAKPVMRAGDGGLVGGINQAMTGVPVVGGGDR